MGWETYTKEATRGTGADWVNPPADIYNCIVQDVSDPTEEVNPFAKDGESNTQLRFYVTFEILDDLDDGNGGTTKGLTFRLYMNLPQAYLDFGSLSDKSKVFEVMEALGYDMDGESFTVDPMDWIGRECRVTTELRKNDRGDERVKVKSLTTARREPPKREAAPAREAVPAGAARGGVRERLGRERD